MKPIWKTAVKIFISTLLLVIILSRYRPSEMWRTVSNADPYYAILAVSVSPIIILSKTLKWFILGRQAGRISLGAASLSLLAGMGAGLITPGRVGEITRIFYLRTADRSQLLGLVVIDRLYDLLIITLAGALALGITYDVRFGIAVAIPVAAILLLFFIPGLMRQLYTQLAALPCLPWRDQFGKIVRGLSSLNIQTLMVVLVFAVSTFVLGTFQFYLLLQSLDVNSLSAAAASFPLLTLAGAIPLSIGGIGIREGASVIVLSTYQISEVVAVNAAFLSFVLNTLIPGAIGLAIAPVISAGPWSSDSFNDSES